MAEPTSKFNDLSSETVTKLVSIIVAIVVFAVVLVPTVNGLVDGSDNNSGNGGDNGVIGSDTQITYTNEGQYYYTDYDKAVADAMAFAVDIESSSNTTSLRITVGDYQFDTPSYPTQLYSGDSGMNEAVFTIPILQIEGTAEQGGQVIEGQWVSAIAGYYNISGAYTYTVMDVFYIHMGEVMEMLSAQTPISSTFESTTIGGYISSSNVPFQMMNYSTIRVISSEGDYVFSKNPIVANLDEVLSYNMYYKYPSTYSPNSNTYYKCNIGAMGLKTQSSITSNPPSPPSLEYYTVSTGTSPTTYNPTVTLNTSNIGGNTRLDGYSILYVGDSSNRFAYVDTCDAYAIVPKTVEYTLSSGDNKDNAEILMKYYESAPTLHIDVSYTTQDKDLVIGGETTTYSSMDTLTLSYNGKTIVYDLKSDLNEFYESVQNTSSSDEIDTLFNEISEKGMIPVLINPPSAVNMSVGDEYNGLIFVRMIVVTNSEQFEDEVATKVPTSIDISSNSAILTYANATTETKDISGYCYLIDNEGEYGCFTLAQISNGIYVSEDILNFDGAIMGEDMGLGFSWISGKNYAVSLYEAGVSLQDNYHISIEEGKLTDIGWYGGYAQTGNNPRGEFGEIAPMFVVLPLNSDEGGNGGDGSDTGGISGSASTIIKSIPIFVGLGLVLGIVSMFYDPRNLIKKD